MSENNQNSNNRGVKVNKDTRDFGDAKTPSDKVKNCGWECPSQECSLECRSKIVTREEIKTTSVLM